MKMKNRAASTPPPRSNVKRMPPIMKPVLDFFWGGAGRAADGPVVCVAGAGATATGGGGGGTGGGGATETSGGGGGGGGAGGGGGGFGLMSAVFGVPVGPAFVGKALVAPGYSSTIVAFGSGSSRLVDFSDAAFRSIAVARIVALGSKVCGAINRPPSNVQNFCPSSGNVRLHFGQLFMKKPLLRCQIG